MRAEERSLMLTRRLVLAGAVATPAALLLPTPHVPAAWEPLMQSVAWTHPLARAAVLRAMAVGMDPAAWSGITLYGHDIPEGELPRLSFGDWPRRYVEISPRGIVGGRA